MSYPDPLLHAARRLVSEATPFRRVLFAVALLLAVPAVYVGWSGAEVTYVAEGTLAYGEAPIGVSDASPVPEGFAWTALVRSYQVMDAVVVEHGLQVGTGDTPLRDGARALSSRLRAEARSGFLSLTLYGDDPEETAEVLRTIMEEVVHTAGELKARKQEQTLLILEEQLAAVTDRLAAAERDLETFRVATIRIPSGRRVEADRGASEVSRGASEVSDGASDPWDTEEDRLERRVRSIANLHEDISARVEAARSERASPTPDLRILDTPAVPTRPARDLRAPVTLAILLGWLGVVSAGVLLTTATGVPTMGGAMRSIRTATEEGALPALAVLVGGALATLLTVLLLM